MYKVYKNEDNEYVLKRLSLDTNEIYFNFLL